MPLEPCPERAHAVRSGCWRRCHGDFAIGAGVILNADEDLPLVLLQERSVAFWGLPAVASRGFPRDNNHHSKPSADLGITRICFPVAFFQDLRGFRSFSGVLARSPMNHACLGINHA